MNVIKRLVTLLLSLVLVLGLPVNSSAARPTDFCTRKPTHPQCVAPTPTPNPTATPTLRPTPTPTVAPTATPTIAPTATPAPGDSWSVPFGTRPVSAALSYNGNCPAVIENKTFKDLGANVIAIKIQNCSNVTIRANDFINVSEGVYAVDSSNINLIDNRYKNITGPYERVGLNRANLVQFNRVSGGLIDHNKGKCGDTEDIVSIYSSSNIIVEDNHFEGVYVSSADCLAWRSNSGTGAISGDGTGTGNIIRRNIMVNPGQVGIAIAGGSNNRLESNIVIGQQRSSPNSNVGMYASNYSSGSCTNNFVTNNRVNYKNAAGNSNGWYLGTCTNTTVQGNNFNDTTLNIENYRVGL